MDRQISQGQQQPQTKKQTYIEVWGKTTKGGQGTLIPHNYGTENNSLEFSLFSPLFKSGNNIIFLAMNEITPSEHLACDFALLNLQEQIVKNHPKHNDLLFTQDYVWPHQQLVSVGPKMLHVVSRWPQRRRTLVSLFNLQVDNRKEIKFYIALNSLCQDFLCYCRQWSLGMLESCGTCCLGSQVRQSWFRFFP